MTQETRNLNPLYIQDIVVHKRRLRPPVRVSTAKFIGEQNNWQSLWYHTQPSKWYIIWYMIYRVYTKIAHCLAWLIHCQTLQGKKAKTRSAYTRGQGAWLRRTMFAGCASLRVGVFFSAGRFSLFNNLDLIPRSYTWAGGNIPQEGLFPRPHKRQREVPQSWGIFLHSQRTCTYYAAARPTWASGAG